MKDDEKIFFRICVKYSRRQIGKVRIREIIGILYNCGFMHYKRCWYLLSKWSGFGFYDWGVTKDLGWLLLDNLPERYASLLDDEGV